ncbi:DUF4267 domain-containing protein [Streptomyces avicenniae]|uniref:DUF4267 domain-containing protein n=1 Tax=Streptomyces avicenniae TaxID=500153 RepID=UPI00069A333A|nr:DUF4267 domain-containing protein [Streptomyces avicenniae]
MLTAALVVTAVIAVGIIAIGLRFLLQPQASAAGFGLPAVHGAPRPWANIKGVRDITSGLVLLVGLLHGDDVLLGWLVLASTFTPLADAAIVLGAKGPKAAAYGIHAATALVALAAALVLILA